MTVLSPTFVFGVVVLLYLFSFVVFAILRVVTGLSIQRIGYFSLRRLAYTLKDGILIEIRGLGLKVHRPSFAQPTWISIVIDELVVTVDIEGLRNHGKVDQDASSQTEGNGLAQPDSKEQRPGPGIQQKRPGRKAKATPTKSWNELIKLKERLKRLHRSIAWLKLVDVVATNSSLVVLGVGTIQVGVYTVAVDTRKRLTDQGHIFTRAGEQKKKTSPAEWIVTVRNVLLTAEGMPEMEILDNAALNIHGYLFKDVEGLREAEIELKLGRVHVPMEDVEMCVKRLKHILSTSTNPEVNDETVALSVPDNTMESISENEESAPPDTHLDEFFTSMLRGIKEVHFAISHICVTRRIPHIQPGGIPLYLNAVMKEVGFDVHRLDPKSPAHRTYFSSQTVAHEALLAALSIAVGVDDGHGKSDRLIYIPMATTTLRTTLPSKAIGLQTAQSADERNANILYANVVITSPSLDLDPKHLPLIVALLQPTPKAQGRSVQGSQKLISRFLPKANIKFSMHEPVFRIALPAVDEAADEDECDLIISSIGSVSLDMESSHSGEAGTNYSLGATFRVQSHSLYYQTCTAVRYDFLQTEFMELKFGLNATPIVSVVATGMLHSFSVRMVRPELRAGILGIVQQLRTNVEPDVKHRPKTSRDVSHVRALPPWLALFEFEANNFSIEIAGIDTDISEEIRGLAVQAESWTIQYQAQNEGFVDRRVSRRRAGSRSFSDANIPKDASSEERPPSTDGRRLALEVRGLEGFVIESADRWELEPFLQLPHFDISASTMSDSQGALLHIDSKLKTLLIEYSLYRHYAVEIALTAVRRAVVRIKEDIRFSRKRENMAKVVSDTDLLSPTRQAMGPERRESSDGKPIELVTAEVSIDLIQVKASMPADPAMMLQLYGVEMGKHRFSPPYFIARLARLYVEDIGLGRIWVRLVSIKQAKIVHRQAHHKEGTTSPGEKVIDISTEAVRLAVPHQVVLHKVFDNVVNTVKAVEQMHHRFMTGTNDYVLEKRPEGAKRVPNISLRSKALLFELEDGAFEWKLGNIYRAGLIEQQQRLARDEGFRVKARKIEEEEQRRDSTRSRARSAHPQRASREQGYPPRSRSEDGVGRRGRSRSKGGYHRMRYDPQGAARVSASARISIAEASEKLKEYNAQSWKRRIDLAYKTQMNAMKDLRGVFWGPDDLPEEMEDTEDILEVPQRPGLMSTLVSDFHLAINKPTFPLSDLPEFMHKIGKGMPYDMKYSLLVPVHVQLDMGECRMSLRDYPLPFIHVPAMKPGQSHKVPSWSLKTNFVIAEEFRGPGSIRHVKVGIVPPTRTKPGSVGHGGFAIDVRRTVSPVKTYSDMDVHINTALPTRITWGASYQPAIQDMMMIIEGFTKPQIDPSERVGFWDKIRLSFHSRLLVSWKGSGDVHLLLKGTRDPYAVTGNGAGFIMCWRNDVAWSLWRENDPKRFMTVDSGDYILAIPDLSHHALNLSRPPQHDSFFGADPDKQRSAVFKKVIMKLSGNVRWLIGLVFERNIVGNKKEDRSFEFIPHYDVILRETSYAKAPPGQEYDAFRGFRSNHIHLSLAVTAPRDRKWAAPNLAPTGSYNSVHLTPRFFTHFYAWWSLFGGTMSLPIRQGRLWPGVEKSSKKFGRHLATIKYSILLAPLFMSHVYKHKEAEDYDADAVAVTGLKIRLDSFMLDIHQRREWFKTQERSRKTQAKTTGMKIHKAQLDLITADIRAISASITNTTPDSLRRPSFTPVADQADTVADLSQFDISDNDYTWVDMDDFVELDWILPSDSHPETKIIPLAFMPGFSYFRDTDHGDTIAGDPDRSSPFGHEPTHFCVMSQDDDPRKVQCHLIKKRLAQLDEQVIEHKRKMGEVELRTIQSIEGDTAAVTELNQMRTYDAILKGKKKFLLERLHDMEHRIEKNIPNAVPETDLESEACSPNLSTHQADNPSTGTPEHKAPIDFVSDFNNRFVIHNIQLKWNNSLRNTILRYIHQVSQRRGFVYYMSRRAVKFILDIVEEQSKAKGSKPRVPSPSMYRNHNPPSAVPTEDEEDGINVQERIQELLADSKKFVDANDKGNFDDAPRPSVEHLTQNIGKDYVPQNSYHLRLIAPQIQLQSDKNQKSVALLTASGMELKVVEVMDKDRLFDEVSGLVQRRFSVEMDGTQFFVTHKNLSKSPLLNLYSGGHYGTTAGSAWPPWVPMEVMFDFEVDPFGFKRIIQKTSASLRYDKYNTLRLKYNDEVDQGQEPGLSADDRENIDSLDSRMDHLWVHFPQLKAICDSQQYYTMYIIVLDLLLYSEPLEKTRNERLEKIMLASDFSDLRGAPEMVTRLQERIRQLEEIKNHFQIHSQFLDRQAWEDRIKLDKDLSACEDELFFMMKAITTSQRKQAGAQDSALLRWNIASDQISWNLMRDQDHPLVEFQLQKAEYDRTDNTDGSHVNLMQIDKIAGLNLLPNAFYPEIITAYFDPKPKPKDPQAVFQEGDPMLRIYWSMREAIAGISIVEHFEANLHPLKVELEREVGDKLYEYIFPGKSFSPEKPTPAQTDKNDDDEDNDGSSSTYTLEGHEYERGSDASSARDGSIELRLRPTLTSSTGPDSKHLRPDAHRPRTAGGKSLKRQSSMPSMRPKYIVRSNTAISTSNGATLPLNERMKQLPKRRHKKDAQPSDDLTEMLNRSSRSLTLAYAKIPSLVILLSYHDSKSHRYNVEDLKVNLPALQFRNEYWANPDLSRISKDILRSAVKMHVVPLLKAKAKGVFKSKKKHHGGTQGRVPPSRGTQRSNSTDMSQPRSGHSMLMSHPQFNNSTRPATAYSALDSASDRRMLNYSITTSTNGSRDSDESEMRRIKADVNGHYNGERNGYGSRKGSMNGNVNGAVNGESTVSLSMGRRTANFLGLGSGGKSKEGQLDRNGGSPGR